MIPVLSSEECARFWAKVRCRGPEACWNWTAGCNDGGYGYFKICGTKHGAHRVAFFIVARRQPGNLFVCHSCDNRKCCNPAHLFLGTTRDNMDDMTEKGRSPRGTRNAKAILNQKSVRMIRASTQSNAALADAYGVCPAAISHVRTRRNWKRI